eukprot:29202-Chlamydomonas_euryale.AAC.1
MQAGGAAHGLGRAGALCQVRTASGAVRTYFGALARGRPPSARRRAEAAEGKTCRVAWLGAVVLEQGRLPKLDM